MNSEDGPRFWKTGLHRELSVGENAEWEMQLADEPEALAQFEEDMALNRLLRQLPEAPVSSNFTAQVMQALAKTPTRRPFHRHWPSWLDARVQHWGRKLALASALLLLGLVSHHQYQLSARRELANSLLQISSVLPSDRLLEDFGAISGLQQVSFVHQSPAELLDALP